MYEVLCTEYSVDGILFRGQITGACTLIWKAEMRLADATERGAMIRPNCWTRTPGRLWAPVELGALSLPCFFDGTKRL